VNLWRLEWLRLVRTRRLVLLVGVYLVFGVTGPLSARYLGELIERFGGGVTVEVPEPTPADGILQFNLNAQQIGLLVVVVVAAGALTVDALPEMSAFLRTRVSDPARLLLPRAVVPFVAASAAYLAGVVVASYQTWALLGPLPWARVALGAGLGVVYLAFVVALTAAAASRTTSVLATVAFTVITLVGLPLAGIVEAIGRWLPSHLVGALDGLARGEPAGDYGPATAMAVLTTAVLLVAAGRGLRRREL
jgi:ABC-2 type transport system permease protein